MRHLKEYDDKLLKDIQNMDLAEKNYGCWICINFLTWKSPPFYAAIVDKDFNSAAYTILEKLFPRSEKYEEEVDKNHIIKDFNQLEIEFTNDFYEGRVHLFGWEMKPRSNDIRDRGIYELDSEKAFNPKEIHEFGQKYFTNFLEVLKNHPRGER